MNLHKYQLYLLEQHSESFKSWSAIIRSNTEGKSLIMKLGPSVPRIHKLYSSANPVLYIHYTHVKVLVYRIQHVKFDMSLQFNAYYKKYFYPL